MARLSAMVPAPAVNGGAARSRPWFTEVEPTLAALVTAAAKVRTDLDG